MDKLAIASVSKENILPWTNGLESNYSLVFFDKVDLFLAKKNEERKLLIIDALLIQEKNQLSLLCQCFEKILVIGESLSSDQQIQFIYEGAWGYSEKSIDEHLMVRAVRGILNNEIWLERQIIPQMLQGIMTKQRMVKSIQKLSNDSFRSHAVLTHREIDVIQLIYCGEDNLAISEKLNITLRTVKAHLSAIYQKFNVQDRFQLVVFLKDLHVGQLVDNDTFSHRID